jgi:hypothetical protein
MTIRACDSLARGARAARRGGGRAEPPLLGAYVVWMRTFELWRGYGG